MVREVLIFISGITVGTIVGMKLAERKFNERLDEAVTDRVEQIHEDERAREEAKRKKDEEKQAKEDRNYTRFVREYDKTAPKPDSTRPINPKPQSEEESTDISGDEDEDEDEEVDEDKEDRLKEEEADEERPRRTTPYAITDEEFDEDNGNDKCSWYWYAGNYVVTNEEDHIVENDDAERQLGHGWRDLFAHARVIYIRNDVCRTDYEVTYCAGDYPTAP